MGSEDEFKNLDTWLQSLIKLRSEGYQELIKYYAKLRRSRGGILGK